MWYNIYRKKREFENLEKGGKQGSLSLAARNMKKKKNMKNKQEQKKGKILNFNQSKEESDYENTKSVFEDKRDLDAQLEAKHLEYSKIFDSIETDFKNGDEKAEIKNMRNYQSLGLKSMSFLKC